jgi:sugar lactone lactonase YvrE
MEPELIADYLNHVGEGPLWHVNEKRLYWVDIPQGRIFWFDPESGEHEQFFQGRVIGGFTIQVDGSLLLFMDRGSIAILRDGELSYVVEEIPEERDTRFNDVIADPRGSVFCGTMPTDTRPAKLYRLDPDGSLTVVLDNIGLSNGLGFTLDRNRMYYTDSFARKIYIFDYDESTSEISNQRVFVETPEGQGIPDGMTVDADGYVWSARADGSALFRYTTDGVQERSIPFPAKKVSSVSFGGPDMDEIYVTTIGGDNKADEGPGAGALFRLKLGIKGVPDFHSRIGV